MTGQATPFRADIRGKLVETASNGKVINYLDLGAGRRMVGGYLYRIALEEAEAGRPPLTAVVVRKDSGRPGEGFKQAMIDAKEIAKDDPRSEEEIWREMLRKVHEYWRPKLTDRR